MTTNLSWSEVDELERRHGEEPPALRFFLRALREADRSLARKRIRARTRTS
jgi:hypothetical protein